MAGVRGVFVCIALAAAGCLPWQKAPTAGGWLDKTGLFAGASGAPPDRVVLHTVLIERPAGDPYLTTELWATTTRPLAPDRAALLAENGIRVGVISGNPPPEFLKLVTSDMAAVRPMASTLSLGAEKVLPVNGPLELAAFAVAADIGGKPEAFKLPGAECGLAITPTAGENADVKLAFEARVQHGRRQGWLRPSADGTAFTWRDGMPAEAFAKLGFDVPLGPKDYLVIGPTETPAGKLGGAFFVGTGTDDSRMRVLVIRAWRGGPTGDGPSPGRRATAAAQASTVARGQSGR